MTKIRTRKKMTISKTNKKRTLDQIHIDHILEFQKLHDSLPHKKNLLRKMKEELETLQGIEMYSPQNDQKKVHLLTCISQTQKEIESIENCTNPLKYISRTLPTLIDYYSIEVDKSEEKYEINPAHKNNVLKYLFGEEGKTVVSAQKTNKANLHDDYLQILYPLESNKKKESNKCSIKDCDGEKIIGPNEGYNICNKCSFIENILYYIDKPNYKDPVQDSGTYAYKRINHLTEILSQLQAKESTDIQPAVFECILRELKKRKINKDDLDVFKLRRILKKLKFHNYYEHVPHILQVINGKKPPNFSRRHETLIKKMFKDIQKPFSLYCPKNRKNFLNYSYILHKFCELLDLDEYISYFPLLKNNTKLLQHDKIWKNICKYMHWKYYKSI